MITLIDAILNLVPDAKVAVNEDGENLTVTWISPNEAPVTIEEIKAEYLNLKEKFKANEFQRNRANEYPSVNDYLDGLVKNDQAQIQAYIDACLKVKEKYPKPE